MKNITAQIEDQDFVGIYPEDLFSSDWWNDQVSINDLAVEIA